MKNFQYVMEKFSSLLREWIIQHVDIDRDEDEGLTDFDIKYQLEKLLGKFQVDLYFVIRDHIHMGNININITTELDTVIDSFYTKVVHPQLTSCV